MESTPPPPPPPPADGALPEGATPDAAAEQKEDLSTFADGPADEAAQERIIELLKTVYDPEIPVDIYQMGMIYEVKANTDGLAYVKMTLTSPSCPVAGSLPGEVEQKVKGVEGIKDAKIDLVWDPPWEMSMISEAARLQLNL